MTRPDDIRRKRLLYRARHRGCKEADVLIGGFAASAVPAMDAGELAELEALLDQPDWLICAWMLGWESPPADIRGPVLLRMMREAGAGVEAEPSAG